MLEILPVESDNDDAMSKIGTLHVELLHFGPFAALGETFVREVCYRKEVEENAMHLAVANVDGTTVGFVAYTSLPYEFHKSIMHKHWWFASYMAMGAILRKPQRLASLARIFRTIDARVRESRKQDEELGEIVCVAVRPDYLKPSVSARICKRLPEELLKFAARDLYRAHGIRRLRMIVDAENRHALFMYHALGARFEKLTWAGEDKTDVYFDLDDNARILDAMSK